MPYQISQPDLTKVSDALYAYYEDAWADGIKGLFNRLAQSQMGVVTGYIDQASDAYSKLTQKSKDKFGMTLKADLKKMISVYTANKNDVASVLVTVAEAALKQLASHIPVPHLGSILSAAITFGAGKAQDELHKRSIDEADKQVLSQRGGEIEKLFKNDKDAAAAVVEAMNQYKMIGKLVQTMPGSITTFDDAVTMPGAVFKLQQAASTLNVVLYSAAQYLAGMQERLAEAQRHLKEYLVALRRDLTPAVNSMLQAAYQEAYRKGEAAVAQNKYSAPPAPTFRQPDKTGGATMLAAYLAHATAQGYYDAGNRGPIVNRPRGVPVGGPPPLPRRI